MTKLEKNWLEWICFAISLLLVISLLGYLLLTAVTTGKSPAYIELELGPPRNVAGSFSSMSSRKTAASRRPKAFTLRLCSRPMAKKNAECSSSIVYPGKANVGESSPSRRTLVWPLLLRHARSDTQSRSLFAFLIALAT